MRKLIKILSLLSIYSLSVLTAQDKQILVINSYHRGFQWSDDLIRGMEDVLAQDVNITVNVLYMDSKRINSREYYDKLLELYQIQLANRKYDLVVAVDKFAYEFILGYYSELFTDEPVMFTGLERVSLEEIQSSALNGKIYGVFEDRSIGENVLIISKLIPNLKKLYIINDQSENGDDSEPFIRKAIEENNKNFDIEYIRSSTLEELEEKFSVYKKDEAILYIRFYNDKDGNYYKNNQIANTIERLKLPVFITDTLFMGKGAFGGKLVLVDELGQESGQLALAILEGKVPPLYIKTFDKYALRFDLNKIKEFHINPSAALKDYDIINTPQTFFDAHREFINFIFIISPLFVLLILGLLHNIYMRLKNEAKLRIAETEKVKHQQFVVQQSKLAEIGEVFSSIAHQWKSPLVEIATIAQEQAFKEKDKDSRYVKDIMVQVQYMTDTIDSFQKFIVPSNKKTNFDIYESIKNMLSIIDHTIKYNYIDVKFNTKNANNFIVNGYKNEFMQTLLNIVNNAKDAIKDAQKAGKIKRGSITFNIYNTQKNITIEIQDNGGGVQDGIKAQIFNAYFTTKSGGHGIGLYMTKLIIEDKMGGTISVSNKKDGACFSITLRSVT
jgi:signal transduction histidine kinase